jgi:hypothetical protein
LPMANHPKVKHEEGEMHFSWDYDPDTESDNRRDQVMLLIYFPKANTSCYQFSGARRSEGFERLDVPQLNEGETAEVYISFVSDDRKSISNSTHIGSFGFPTQISKTLILDQDEVFGREQELEKLIVWPGKIIQNLNTTKKAGLYKEQEIEIQLSPSEILAVKDLIRTSLFKLDTNSGLLKVWMHRKRLVGKSFDLDLVQDKSDAVKIHKGAK